jgi:hypothetical protein
VKRCLAVDGNPKPSSRTRTSGFEGPASSCFSPADDRETSISHGLQAPGQDMERNAPTFVVGDEWNRISPAVPSKAARCEARAAFELSGSAAAVWRRGPALGNAPAE